MLTRLAFSTRSFPTLTLYVDKGLKKKPGGSKQMKSKERITLMVCTAASGEKVPLAMVGKAKKPECFKLCKDHKPPMAYTHSSKGWFTRGVTKWWILEVFIPHHQKKWGNEPCILILDNCPAHDLGLEATMTPLEKARKKQAAQEDKEEGSIVAPARMPSQEEKRKQAEELAKLQDEEKKALERRKRSDDDRKRKGLHQLVKFVGPSWLKIIFLPPNLTAHCQPADQGMISSLKAGYKCTMLEKLLSIFDAEGGYEKAAKERLKLTKGQRGIEFGGKAHVLDAMIICNEIWGRDGRWATEDGIRRCWRKAGILPQELNQATDAEIGRGLTKVSTAKKTLSKEDTDEICALMRKLIVKAPTVNISKDAVALKDSFAEEGTLDDSMLEEMANRWVDIEDDPEIIEEEVNEAIDELMEAENVLDISDAEDDDSEPEAQAEEVEVGQVEEYLPKDFFEAEEMVWKLKRAAPKLGMEPDDIGHLDNFLRAMRRVKNSKAKRDSTMHAYFKKVTKDKGGES